MCSLKEYVFTSVRESILSWDGDLLSDIYVLSFYVETEDDDLRKPRLVFGYNTETNYKENLTNASNRDEARWNYAFWLQNEEIIIGDNYEDENFEALILRDQWVKDSKWYYGDELEEDNFDKAMDLGKQIVADFYQIVKETVKRLHNEGMIKSVFDKDIPLIIHELEYDDAIAEMNKEINPKICIDEFVEWIDTM
ncbi:hypothetical protein MH117_19345 [Paenibacillus sp. ACRRX]|uniref:hypothetical protein n=1 Tax=Paenibacillus sp. ACRRX TaxID=2918206 RepID=UPI001EF61599|nr:hypothetical protein [Paenibacillus sp. ACRRX]MCG7409566.1 hypothetical protein [Paenibacillus sp. ACRRX]